MPGILEQPPGQRTVEGTPSEEARLCDFELDRLHGRLQKE